VTVNYKLEFHIMMDFITELEDTSSDAYRWHNETIGELVSVG